jgi:hypothetical protein
MCTPPSHLGVSVPSLRHLTHVHPSDVVQPRHTTPSGPMTRARVKALHDKVNSLLSMCDLDTPLNGLLLHSDTLCILRNNYQEDHQASAEVGQGTSQEEDEEDEASARRYYRQEGRYYRQDPGSCTRRTTAEDEDLRGVPGSGTTAAPAVLPPGPDHGTTARGTAGGTGTSENATGYPYGTSRYPLRTTASERI